MNKEQEELLEEVTTEETVAEITESEKQLMEEVDNMDKIEVVYVEKEGFFKEHGDAMAKTGAGVAGAAAIFTGGFFAGKYSEKKKRDIFMKEIRTRIRLIEAEAEGYDEVELNGEEMSTKEFKVEEVDDLINIISKEFMNNKKVKAKEKADWTNLAVELASAGAKARAKQIIKDKEVVKADD